MNHLILCATADCCRAYSTVCDYCARKLCVDCYGPGSSSRCNRCYRRLAAEQAATEERLREAASQAASW